MLASSVIVAGAATRPVCLALSLPALSLSNGSNPSNGAKADTGLTEAGYI